MSPISSRKMLPVSELEFPFLLLNGPGKGPLFVTKKFAFHKTFRDSGTINDNKRFLFANAIVVDCPRHNLFARPCLAMNQYGGVILRSGPDCIDDSKQGWALADHALVSEFKDHFCPLCLQPFHALEHCRLIEIIFRWPLQARERIQGKMDFRDGLLAGSEKSGWGDFQ
jgi:hypothetical protein